MLNEIELKAARYKSREKEADAVGRLITVRKLRPSEDMKINSYTADLTGNFEVTAKEPQPDGSIKEEKALVPHRSVFVVAAAVCDIDGAYIPFPNNRAELDAILDRLDSEGIAAASKAYGRLIKNDPSQEQQQELAKNSLGTPPSDLSLGS